MSGVLGHSITYRVAVGLNLGRKVMTLQSLRADDRPLGEEAGKVSGFSLQAGVAARADQREKLERLARYISRPAVSEKRLSLTSNGLVRYQPKFLPKSTGRRTINPAIRKIKRPKWTHRRRRTMILYSGKGVCSAYTRQQAG